MKINEYGRSMVEMLGVLAIMGVLSATGIYGYKIAMRRHQANEIATMTTTLMMLAHTANAGEGGCVQLSTSDLPNSPGGVNVDIVADTDVGGQTYIQLINYGNSDDVTSLCDAVTDLLKEVNPICGDTLEQDCSSE